MTLSEDKPESYGVDEKFMKTVTKIEMKAPIARGVDGIYWKRMEAEG